MANLEFCDKHNMVTYLKKPTWSEGFQLIFWQTATVRTVDNGEQEITATVDGKEFTITEASVRRHLQLADVDGEHTPLFPSMLAIQEEEGEGGSPRYQEVMGGSIAQTRFERVPTYPYDSPLPRVNTLGSDEGSMTLLELTVLCTTLSKKVESLEADLKQTKKGRMIEKIDQDTGITLVTPTHSQEDQLEDQLGVFSVAKVLANAAKENVHTYTRRRRAVSTGSGRISTVEESVNTAGASIPVVIKYKGKAKMNESKPEKTKTKLQQRQERAGYEAAVRLQEKLDEEERKRITRVHKEASSFNIEEWEDIQATIEAGEELAQRIQAEEIEKYSEAEKSRLLVELIN
ncbi:hypothetical protein Tco_1406614 [Tanacetum coccineum]